MKSIRAFATEPAPGLSRARRNRRRLGVLIFGVLALPVAMRSELEFGPSRVARAAGQASAPSAIDQQILPERFRTTWDPGIPGGIPRDNDLVRPAEVWLPSGNPYGGYSVNPALAKPQNAAKFTAALQSAINAAGQVATPNSRRIVKLKAGSYYVAPQAGPLGKVGIHVTVDNVTIRGEGANTTRLTAAGQIPELGTVVLFGHRSGWFVSPDPATPQNVTVSAARGDRTIAVANAATFFQVGDVITIDRQDGDAVPRGPALFNGGQNGYLWFYDAAYFKRQPARDWNGPETGAPTIGGISTLEQANAYAQSAVPYWRSRMQTTEITAILGNTLEIKDPLHLDFPAGPSAAGGESQVWRTVPINTSMGMGNRWSGIEDIAVAGGNSLWGFPGGTVAFSYMAYGWAKNIEADGDKGRGRGASPGKYGWNIGVGRSYRVVVRDSYAHGSADINPGGHAYGIVVGIGSSACLVENNISVNNNKPVALNATGGGNVIAYNYVDQAIIWSSPEWQENAIDDNHGAFTHHDLIEGNWTANLGGDTTHGNSGWHTHLRNYAHGTNLLGGAKTANVRAVGMDGWTHDHAYIGNVLNGGTVYETTPFQRVGIPVYQLGNNYAGIGGNWDNGYAELHIYRDGNWDNVSNDVVWDSASCAKPGAPTCSIPASFYLSGRPAFFTTGYSWPWVNPTAARVGRLPAKARFDAGTPNVPVP